MAYKNKNEQQNWIYADLLLVHLVIIFADFENVKRKFINPPHHLSPEKPMLILLSLAIQSNLIKINYALPYRRKLR